MGQEPVRDRVRIDDAELGSATMDTATWGTGPVEIVLAHDGLGSIAQWRVVPARLAAATGKAVMAYDRPGHGTSTPVPSKPWPPHWHTVEARRLGLLLDAVGAEAPVLVGHSDGGTIALLHAAEHQTTALAPAGVLALAPHSWVERVCTSAIAAMVKAPEQVVASLAKSHDNAQALFDAWSGGWLSDEFATWDIRATLATVMCPTLVVQGEADQYATPQQAIQTAAAVGENAHYRLLPDIGHVLHHDNPDLVVRLAVEVVAAAKA